MRRLLSLLLAAAVLACGASNPTSEPTRDAGTEVEFPDAGTDAGPLPDLSQLLDTSSPRTFYESIVPAFEAVHPAHHEAVATAVHDTAKSSGWIPIIFDTTVVFLFQHEGDAKVLVAGDMNAWNPEPSATPPRIELVRQYDTSLYMDTYTAPSRTARLDYKIVRGGVWLLDPGNPKVAYGGFGPNSEFALPDYEYSPWVEPRSGIVKGTLGAPEVIASARLGYDVRYQVYTPGGYDPSAEYPLLVTTDGHEYADPRLGAIPIVADNLIAAGLVEPLVIVFVDPRDPANLGTNRRASQYVSNPQFAEFLAVELMAEIRADHAVAESPDRTAILGTSLGGLNSAYLGLTYAEVFGLIAMQSPALGYRASDANALTKLFADSALAAIQKIWIDAGTVYDTHVEARQFKALLESKGYPAPSYHEFDEGHSWGSWRARVDDVLIYFFAK